MDCAKRGVSCKNATLYKKYLKFIGNNEKSTISTDINPPVYY